MTGTAAGEVARERLRLTGFDDLAGWRADRHDEAFSALQNSCREIVRSGSGFSRTPLAGGRREHWSAVCQDALNAGPALDAARARAFFEHHFVAARVMAQKERGGLFTGYYEPEVLGDVEQSARFNVPLYARPGDLVRFNDAQKAATGLAYGRVVDGQPLAYHARRDIEHGAIADNTPVVAWLSSWADAFFMQVQGSGRVRLPGGDVLRLAYDGKTGLPYTAIGAILIERGEITKDAMSMQKIRHWIDRNPRAGRELMWRNASYVFFKRAALSDPDAVPPGAQQVALTAGRSLAVDRRYWQFGTPVWLETVIPAADGAGARPFHQLMIAQDTGSAIKGWVRGDIFFGAGNEAALRAGAMKAPGTMVVLLPVAVARSLNLTTAE